MPVFEKLSSADMASRGDAAKLVPISSSFAHNLSSEAISNWRPITDVWALKYYPFLLGTTAALPGLALVSNLQRRYKVPSLGSSRFIIQMPTVVVAGGMAAMFGYAIRQDILLGITPCPVCVETRSVCGQLATGLFLPFILTSTVGYIWLRMNSYKVPTQFKEVPSWFMKNAKGSRSTLLASLVMQVAVSSLVTYMQFDQWQYLNEELEARMKDPAINARIDREMKEERMS